MRTKRLAAGLVGGLVAYAAVQRLRQADLRGQVVLITGGSRGLGFLLARELGQLGCRVVICGRDRDQLNYAEQTLRRDGISVDAVACDVGNLAEVQQLVNETTARYGSIDILIANAGIMLVGPLEQMTGADYGRAMDVMFWGVVHPALSVLPEMRRRRQGRIVVITSIGGFVSVPRLGPYAAAKFAAAGFSEGLAAEVAKDGIQVMTVVPGLMRTGSHLHAKFLEPQTAQFRAFAPLASLPVISMDAERAARRIVTGLRRGERELILSLPANILARVHGLAPGLTTRILDAVNRILPADGTAGRSIASGHEIQAQSPSVIVDRLTTLGRDAARRFLEDRRPA